MRVSLTLQRVSSKVKLPARLSTNNAHFSPKRQQKKSYTLMQLWFFKLFYSCIVQANSKILFLQNIWLNHCFFLFFFLSTVFTRKTCMCACVSCVCVFVWVEGCQLFCVGGLYWMWQESPTGASGTWQSAAGPRLALERKVTAGKTNQTLPPPLPLLFLPHRY